MPGEASCVPTFDVWRVDAFTTQPLAGNPAAIVLGADALDECDMARIAREFNLSETAFVLQSTRADFRVRYFTPLLEMPLAGHPTIATAHALRELGRIPLGATVVTFEMPAGIIPVEITVTGLQARYTMTQLEAVFLQTYRAAPVAGALGLGPQDVARLPVQTVSTGAPFLLVPLRSEAALARVVPDRRALFGGARDYLGVHAFVRTHTGTHAFAARHFSPPGEAPEDPATGSACGALAAYARRHGLIGQNEYTVLQGTYVGRPGTIYVQAGGGPHARSAVRVGGNAVTIARGRLELPITRL